MRSERTGFGTAMNSTMYAWCSALLKLEDVGKQAQHLKNQF
ncbi:hypothetical protein AQS8620_02659 [Aquimixticola soesokkakensis]|uniref:Uncharacterized protein n=1 Tax=Aquimixticola soesokkakensis TaxID=1519096 RepID=A0A1Y5TG10_9RHOB|nr:hypothetical protein AQS8620_02659 [Aquimixticola soesokkakensis]